MQLYIQSRNVSHGLVRSRTISHGLSRSCMIASMFKHGHGTRVSFLKKFQKSYTAFTDTLEWPECNSDKATVGSVVCTVYTGDQPYKPCVLCQSVRQTLIYSAEW